MTPRAFVVVALVVGLFVGWCYGRAVAADGPTPATWHRAVIVCPGWAEDSAANVRLVRFEPGEVTRYRCLSSGY